MRGGVVPSAGDAGAQPAAQQAACEKGQASSDTQLPVFDSQNLLVALLTCGGTDALDIDATKALRLTCKAVRDLTDRYRPPNAVRFRYGRESVDSMLNRSLAFAVVAIELLGRGWQQDEAVADDLNAVLDHHLVNRIQNLSFPFNALGEATGPIALRIAALPALASLNLPRAKPAGIVNHIEAGIFAALTSLELEILAAHAEEASPQMWQSLASLPRLARLRVHSRMRVCFPLDIHGEMQFMTLEDLELVVYYPGFGAVPNRRAPCPWLETVTWPALSRFSAGPLVQGVVNSLAKGAWLSQLTELNVELGDNGRAPLQGGALMDALSGSTALRRLSLSEFGGGNAVFRGFDFPCLEALRIELSGHHNVAGSVLADLMGASIPRIRELSLMTGDPARQLAASPTSALDLAPFPLLQRLEVSVYNLTASMAFWVPAYHAIPLLLMKSAVEVTFHKWDGLLTIVNALWDIDGGVDSLPPPPAWPHLRVLRLSGSCHASHVLDALRGKAGHCPALREVWIDVTSGGDWWGAFVELKVRARAAAASGCWPNLKLMTIRCGDETDGAYEAVWCAT